MSHDLTHLDLFSGIGGFALAAQRAGFRTIGFSEVEPYACRVLDERFSCVPNLGDARKRESFAGLCCVTVLSAGYPCQGESLTGLRLGANDDRWLWPATCDVIQETKPTWFIGENVLGHITMGLDTVLSDLEGIGYAAQPFIVPACAVDARHRRDRVWIVGHSVSPRLEGHARNVKSEEGRNASTRSACSPSLSSWGQEWPAEPELGRVANGVSNRSHRLKALGNAIVPQVAEPFFRWIAQIERGEIA